jgi:DNA-binding transcriptional ArsR family regulator
MPSSAPENRMLVDAAAIAELQQHAQQAAELLKQLGNQNRLMILCSLINQELSVGELHKLTHLSQSALSQHLASLRKAHLVQTRREAQTIYYSLLGDKSIKIISVLKSIYCP